MFLSSLEIKNYRSLEHVELDKLGRFNVLIGRNNSGKSAVFGALTLLNNVIRGVGADWEAVLTDKDKTRSLEMRLLFQTRLGEREEFINLLCGAGHSRHPEALKKSPLLRQVEFLFRAPRGTPGLLHLRETRLLAEDNRWAVAQRMVGAELETNPISNVVNIGEVAKSRSSECLRADLFDVERNPTGQVRISVNYAHQGQGPFHGDTATRWALTQLDTYLSKAFFFNPFRHSTARLQVRQTDQLAQDGSNLAQVLHTINSNNRDLFARIEKFVHAGLPDIGILQTPLIGDATEINFRFTPEDYAVRLHDMGGGIEQLLMIATALLTTRDECTLFIEEPESHIHTGAQRFIIDRLYQGDRQIFVTTHSPTFVNLARPSSIYQFKYASNRTTVDRVTDTASLSAVLEDIGIRNSDVLLSDAVLFVEGRADREGLTAWSETLGTSFTEHNVTLLRMGGGEHAVRHAPIRSDVLEGISQKAPVPHLFVLDRDERGRSEIDKLQQTLGDRVHILQKRELENYLLVPRALLSSIRSKCEDNSSALAKVEVTTGENIDELIQSTAESLYGVVLLKRIRAELGGVPGGLLPRDAAKEMAPQARNEDLPRIVLKEVDSRVTHHIASLNIEGLVREQREALDREWSDRKRRLDIVPGEEIVVAVFQRFGVEYKKPGDTARIAKEMRADEIAPEIKELIKKAIALVARTKEG